MEESMQETIASFRAAVAARKGMSLRLFRHVEDNVGCTDGNDSPGNISYNSCCIDPATSISCRFINPVCNEGSHKTCCQMVDDTEKVAKSKTTEGDDDSQCIKAREMRKQRFSVLLLREVFCRKGLLAPREVKLFLRPSALEKKTLGAILTPSNPKDEGAHVIIARWAKPIRGIGGGPLERACADYRNHNKNCDISVSSRQEGFIRTSGVGRSHDTKIPQQTPWNPGLGDQILAINGVSLQGLLTIEALDTIDLIAASPSGIQNVTLRETKAALTPIQKRVAKLHAAHAAISARAAISALRCDICAKGKDEYSPGFYNTERHFDNGLGMNNSGQQLRRESSGRLLRTYKSRHSQSQPDKKKSVMHL